jgi:hypothetical protein
MAKLMHGGNVVAESGRFTWSCAVQGWDTGEGVAYSDPTRMYTVSTSAARVEMRQARLALLYSDLLVAVDSALTAMPGVDGQAARIEWEFALTVARDNPLVVAMAAILGITSAQMDDLLTYASTIP